MNKSYPLITRAIAGFILIVAVIILINYEFNITGLATVLKFSQVNFNTAICFILSAICLFLSNDNYITFFYISMNTRHLQQIAFPYAPNLTNRTIV